MKRSSLHPTPPGSPGRAPADAATHWPTGPCGTPTLLDRALDWTDDKMNTQRQKLLAKNDFNSLSDLLAVRPELPLEVQLENASAAEVHTLADALPEDEPTPPIVLVGSLPEHLSNEALAAFFTHPTLHSLTLCEPMLTRDQLETLVEAVRAHPSALISLSYQDEAECLLDPEFATLIGELQALETLTIVGSNIGYGTVDGSSPDALRLAQTLLRKPLAELELRDCGALLDALLRCWSERHRPDWQQLTVSQATLCPSNAQEAGELARFLALCVANPSIQTLVLKDFWFSNGDPHDALGTGGPHSPESRRLAQALSGALARRTRPLRIELEGDDVAALAWLLGSVSQRPLPHQPHVVAEGSQEAGDRPGTPCIRELELVCRPPASPLEDPPGQQRPFLMALDGITDALPRLPRLHALNITLDIPLATAHDAPPDASVGAGSGTTAAALQALAQALDRTHLTSLTLEGTWPAPAADILGPSLHQVGVRALRAELEMRSLDACFGFVAPPSHRDCSLPLEVGDLILQELCAGGPAPEPLVTLPLVSGAQMLAFVDRYNALAARRGMPLHPFSAIGEAVRQRRRIAPASPGA